MDTEPFDEAELLVLPPSAVVTPPRRLKRLKKSSSKTVNATEIPPAGSPLPPPLSPPPPPPPPPLPASPGVETLAPRLSPPSDSSPPKPTASDADDALSPLPLHHSSPDPDSSPLPPTDSPDEEEEDDGLDPLFSESGPAAGWDPVEGDGEDEEEMLGGGLIEELRRETAAKKRLDMDEVEEEMGAGAEAKGERSKRKRKEVAPKESARGKKRSSEKERRVELESIHAESQRLLRETRSASFKPTVQPVYKPISSVLDKIRLRKLEILKKTNTPIEDNCDDDAPSEPANGDDAPSQPANNSAGLIGVSQVKEVTTDVKDLKIDDVDKEFVANDHDLDRCDSIPEDEDTLNSKKDLGNSGPKTSNEEIFDCLQDNHDKNGSSSENHIDLGDQTQSHPSSPTKSTDETLSEDEEDNEKENIDPSSQENDENVHEHPEQATGDSCPDVAILKDFLDDEAEEEDDSDDDLMRFKDEEDDGSDENEVYNDLIEVGYEEKEVDHKKRNKLHQKWLQQQDDAETNNVIQRLKFGCQEKELLDDDDDEDEDEDIEECEDEPENETSHDLTPANIVRQNSEKARQMVAKMFTDDNDVYEHSDDDEIEENLARQRISKRVSSNGSLISPLEDDNSREVFSLIKKLNIAPQPKRRGKQTSSNHEMLVTGKNSTTSKSSFLGRTASGLSVSSHRSVYRSYVFGRDDSNSSSRSCMASSESISETDQANPNQPKKAKFSSSQPKPTGSRTNSEGGMNSSVSLFEILRRSSSVTSDKQEDSRQESCATITESQAVHQFSAFKLSRRFSKVGARN